MPIADYTGKRVGRRGSPIARRRGLERVGTDSNQCDGGGSFDSDRRGPRRDGGTWGKRRNAPTTSPGGRSVPPYGRVLLPLWHMWSLRRRGASHPMCRNLICRHRLLKARLATGEKRDKPGENHRRNHPGQTVPINPKPRLKGRIGREAADGGRPRRPSRPSARALR